MHNEILANKAILENLSKISSPALPDADKREILNKLDKSYAVLQKYKRKKVPFFKSDILSMYHDVLSRLGVAARDPEEEEEDSGPDEHDAPSGGAKRRLLVLAGVLLALVVVAGVSIFSASRPTSPLDRLAKKQDSLVGAFVQLYSFDAPGTDGNTVQGNLSVHSVKYHSRYREEDHDLPNVIAIELDCDYNTLQSFVTSNAKFTVYDEEGSAYSSFSILSYQSAATGHVFLFLNSVQKELSGYRYLRIDGLSDPSNEAKSSILFEIAPLGETVA